MPHMSAPKPPTHEQRPLYSGWPQWMSVCARSVGALEFPEVHVVRSLLRFAPRLLEVGVLGYFVEDTGPLREKAQALRHGIRPEAGG